MKLSEKMKELVQDSIDHWVGMRDYARKQNPRGRVIKSRMKIAINETWAGDYCPLCDIFCENLSEKVRCQRCLLYLVGLGCNEIGSSWGKVDGSKTWGKWLKNSEEMLKNLKSLLEG